MGSSEEFYALVNRSIKNTHLKTHSSAYRAENKLEQSLEYCPPQTVDCLRSTRSGDKLQNSSDINSPSLGKWSACLSSSKNFASSYRFLHANSLKLLSTALLFKKIC